MYPAVLRCATLFSAVFWANCAPHAATTVVSARAGKNITIEEMINRLPLCHTISTLTMTVAAHQR
ncbi:hypothetical protein BgiMline_017580, partial [Biomphalaria glabrata]